MNNERFTVSSLNPFVTVERVPNEYDWSRFVSRHRRASDRENDVWKRSVKSAIEVTWLWISRETRLSCIDSGPSEPYSFVTVNGGELYSDGGYGESIVEEQKGVV